MPPTVYRYNILLEYSKDEQSSTDSRNERKEHNEHLLTNRTASDYESKAWFYYFAAPSVPMVSEKQAFTSAATEHGRFHTYSHRTSC